MRRDRLSTEQILEELVDRVAVQIDRRAPVAFDAALGELVRYHQFLLALYAAERDDGPFSYAEFSGTSWHPPHAEWISQYRRLFGRAAEAIPDEPRFLDTLAYVPYRLFNIEPGSRLSKSVTERILDLFPMLMHALEAWVTRRSITEGDSGDTSVRRALSGSDAHALAQVLPGLVGAWETARDLPSRLYGWDVEAGTSPSDLWARYAQAWPFLRQHLANTAYCLAVAVWNYDPASARMFREALVRWPDTAMFDVDGNGLESAAWQLTADLLDMDWETASERAAKLDRPFYGPPSPGELFSHLVEWTKRDIVQIVTSIMLIWSMREGSVAELAGGIARQLLGGVEGEGSGATPTVRDPRERITGLVRMQLTGERFEKNTYGAWLDELVRSIDAMREAAVVPGRLFTPRTMDEREDLLVGDAALFVALTQAAGGDRVIEALDALAAEDEFLPQGDNSLRDILAEFDRYRSVITNDASGLERALEPIVPASDRETAINHADRVLGDIMGAIEARRRARLLARPIDAAALDEIAQVIEAGLFVSDVDAPFFIGVTAKAVTGPGGEEARVRFERVEKGRLVKPQMVPPSSNWGDVMARAVQEAAGSFAFEAMIRGPHETATVAYELDQLPFWQALLPLAKQVGDDPVLVVPTMLARNRLDRLNFGVNPGLEELRISYQGTPRQRGHYLMEIEGVEIFAADVAPDRAWLFSARHLKSIGFASPGGRRVQLDYQLDENFEGLLGTLTVIVHAVFEWSPSPVFEILLGAATDDGADNGPDGGRG